MTEFIDSYQRFLDTFGIKKEELYTFGIKEAIYPPLHKVEEYWEHLKYRIYNNQKVTIRGYGRDAKGTKLYTDLYKNVFNNSNVIKDPTNNSEPQKIISQITGYKRNKNIFNYQVSHIFGKTKNVFLFEAPWNIVLIPKIIDPLTGHETKGEWPMEFQYRFIKYTYKKYERFINEYNEIISNPELVKGIFEYVDQLKKLEGPTKAVIQFEKDVKLELSPITLPSNM